MKVVAPKAELVKHDCGVYEFIEKVGRVCYKSEDKIGEGTAIKFVNQLVNNHHLAMCEHEYLYYEFDEIHDIINFISQSLIPNNQTYDLTKFLNIVNFFVTGNVRAWIEFFDKVYEISQKFEIGTSIYESMHKLANTKYPEIFPLYPNWKYDDESEGGSIGVIDLVSRDTFISEVKETCHDIDGIFFKSLPHTVKFTADRGFLAEITRHRTASFAAESTRFCNYSQGKYNEEITVIEPCFWSKDGVSFESASYNLWEQSCKKAEAVYISMTKNGVKPEEARTVLPQSLKTEVVVTATEEEWQHILDLRWHGTTGKPHPQMKQVMDMIAPVLIAETEGRLK